MKNGRITSVVKIIGIVFLAAGLAAWLFPVEEGEE